MPRKMRRNNCNVGVPHPPIGFAWKWPVEGEVLKCVDCADEDCADSPCSYTPCKNENSVTEFEMKGLPVLKLADGVPTPPEGFKWVWPVGDGRVSHKNCDYKCKNDGVDQYMICIQCGGYSDKMGLNSLPILKKL